MATRRSTRATRKKATSNFDKKEPFEAKDSNWTRVDVTKCPICKDVLQTPKELSCLHTFCERCIGRHIQKSKGDKKTFRFRCPKCHELQGINDSAESSENIARSLPINHFISSLLSKSPTPKCKQCAKGKKSTYATYWCTYCADALCDDHNEYHSEVTSNDVHKVYRIESASKEPDSSYAPAFCSSHPSKLTNDFCREHEVCICEVCKRTSHKHCLDIVSVDEEANNLRHGAVTHSVNHRLKATNTEAESAIKELEQNTTDLDEMKTHCNESIRDIRERVDLHMNLLQKRLLTKLHGMYTTKVSQLRNEIDSFETKRQAMRHYRHLLNTVLEKGTGIQILREVPRVEKATEVVAEKTLHRAARAQTSSLEVKPLDIIPHMKSLGRIVETEIKAESVVGSSPLLEVTKRKLKATNVPKFHSFRSTSNRSGFLAIRYQSSKITGAASFDGNIIVSDYTCKEIRTYQSDGTRREELMFTNLSGNPWDVAHVPGNIGHGTLVFTLPHRSRFVLTRSTSVTPRNGPQTGILTYTTSLPCYGVACAEGLVILACLRCLEIWRVGSLTEPTFEDRIETKGDNVQYVHTVDGERLYYSNSTDHGSVYCVTQDNNIIFHYKHPSLHRPRGIATDVRGNVYIAGYTSNNVHKVSPDGELLQIIALRLSSFTKPCVLVDCDNTIYCVYGNHKVMPIY